VGGGICLLPLPGGLDDKGAVIVAWHPAGQGLELPAVGDEGGRVAGAGIELFARVGALKLLRKTGLFENTVSGVARSDFPIYGKSELCERAVPNFVVTFALSLNVAIMFGKDFFDNRRVVSHFEIGS
jgi:hypothetical protein